MRWWRRRSESDFAAEIRSHIELQADELTRRGHSDTDASSLARRAFGNVTSTRERYFESQRVLWFDQLQQDLRYTVRMLRRAPVVYAVTIAVLAIGIGMNAGAYSVFRAFAVQTLPVPQPESLFRLRGGEASPGGAVALSARVSGPDYRDVRSRLTTATDLAAFVPFRTAVEVNGQLEDRRPLTLSPGIISQHCGSGRCFLAVCLGKTTICCTHRRRTS